MSALGTPWHTSPCRTRPAAWLVLAGPLALAGCAPAPPTGEAPAVPSFAAQATAPRVPTQPAADSGAPLPQIAAPPAVASAIPSSGVGPPEPVPVVLAGRPFFCAPLQPPPGPVAFCTRSIGAVDCWTRPPLATPPLRGLADGRATLTAQQEARRNQCWPGFF